MPISFEEFSKGKGVRVIGNESAIASVPREPQKSLMQQGEDFSLGFVKRSLGTARNVASALQNAGQAAIAGVRSIGPETFGEALQKTKESTGIASIDNATPEGAMVNEALSTENAQGAEKAGAIASDIAAFLLPSSKIAKLEKGMPLLGRMATEGTVAGATTLAQEGWVNDNVKVAALIGAAFPLAGAIAKETYKQGTKVLGAGSEAVGKKIQQTIIRPNAKDYADGFKIDNLQKYKIGGGSKDMLIQTEQLLNTKGKAINDISKSIDEAVDLNKVAEMTRKQFGGDKFATFAENPGIERVLTQVDDNIKNVAGENGKATFWQALQAKRSAGQKGAWVFGSADPDANAVEQVYTAFYKNLNAEMKRIAEKTGNTQLITLNKEVSELIPISNAMTRRMPIEMRNNLISLTDTIGLVGSAMDPHALAILGANKLSKSGVFADILVKAGQSLKNASAVEPTSSIGKRVFGVTNPVEETTKTLEQKAVQNTSYQ